MADAANNTIYGLEATDDVGRIRYVGKTRGRVSDRVRCHKYDCRRPGFTSPACRWIAETLDRGSNIQAIILQSNALDEDEARWIKIYRDQSGDLLNSLSGGSVGARLDDAGRERQSLSMRRRVKELGGCPFNRGELGGKSKLTEDKVRQIRKEYESGGTSFRKLAAKFGVSGPSIRLIVKRLSWSHI